MESGLERLNSLPANQAEAEFGRCCGSTSWARRLIAERPFANEDDLIAVSDRIWWSLQPDDWLEAFSSHPKIGEGKVARATAGEAPNQPARAVRAGATENWAEQEQSGIRNAADETLHSLAELNRRYEVKFGYIYIVCATGKTSEEMLTILQERLNNDPDTELRIAAREQSRITKLRLRKLLNQ